MPVSCKSCAATLNVSKSQAGQRIRCPHCGTSLTVRGSAGVMAAPAGGIAPLASPVEPLDSPAANPARMWIIGGIVGVLVLAVLGLGIGLPLMLMNRDKPTTEGPSNSGTNNLLASNTNPNDTGIKGSGYDPLHGTLSKPGVDTGTTPGNLNKPGIDVMPPPGDPAKPNVNLPTMPSKFASFMGATATGNRFCIIADNSGSMNLNRRIDTLKRELKKTLTELRPGAEFYVFFFNTTDVPMRSKRNGNLKNEPTWLPAGPDADDVIAWFETSIGPYGGTIPTTAFQKAFQLDPKPDAIFFMTDGMIPPNVPDTVRAMNTGDKKIPIHTILFGGEPNSAFPGRPVPAGMAQALARMEGSLKAIAKDSGGEYRFVSDNKPAGNR